MITLNPSSKKSAFSLDVRAEEQGLALMTLTAEGLRSGSEQTVTAALAAEDADVSLSYMEKKGSIDASLKIADGYGDGIRGTFTLQGTELNASARPARKRESAERSARAHGEGPARRQLVRRRPDAQRQRGRDADFDPAAASNEAEQQRAANALLHLAPNVGALDFALSGSFSIVKIDDFTVEAPSDVYTPEETEDILNGDLPLTGLPSFDF